MGAFDVMESIEAKKKADWPQRQLMEWIESWVTSMEQDREIFGLTPEEEAHVARAKRRLEEMQGELQ